VKNSGRILSIFASKNEAVCCSLQTPFGSFRPMRFMKKVLDAFSRFMRPKTKLFSVKFRRILEVFGLQGLQKKFWAQFHGLCVQKRSCFPWSSDAFSKFSASKVQRKSFGRNFTIYVSRKQTFLTSTFCKNVLGMLCFTILRTHKFFCVVGTHCEVLNFHIL